MSFIAPIVQVIDEDDFSSNSDTKVPTQQSTKAYVDSGLSGKANSSHNHAASDITSGTFADALVAASNITQHLLDEDNFASDSPTKAPTQQSAKAYVDAAISAILGGVSSAFDTLSEIATALADKVANTLTLTAGSGLTGGGDLTTDRSFAVDINGLTEDTSPDADNDFLMTFDASATALKKVKPTNLPGGGSGVTNPMPFISGVSRGTLAYDHLEAADDTLFDDGSTPRTTPSGHTWDTSGTGATTAKIVGGKTQVTDNTYFFLNLGENVKEARGAFSFLPGSGSNDPGQGVLTIMATRTSAIEDALHCVFGPRGFDLSKRLSAGSFTSILTGLWAEIPADGQARGIIMRIDAASDTVYIRGPDGLERSITDSDVSTIMADCKIVGYQVTEVDATGYNGHWHAMLAGPSTVDEKIRALGLGAPAHDVEVLRGFDAYKEFPPIEVTLTTAGYHRIATQATFITFRMGLEVTISAYVSGVISQRWSFWAQADYGDTLSAANNLKHLLGMGDGVFDTIRISNDSSAFQIALDANLANSLTTVVKIRMRGVGTPNPNPTSGATALTTSNATLSFAKP